MFIKKDCIYYSLEKELYCIKTKRRFNYNTATGVIFPNCRKCKYYKRRIKNEKLKPNNS